MGLFVSYLFVRGQHNQDLIFFHPNHIANIHKLWWNSYKNMTRIIVVILIFAVHEYFVQNMYIKINIIPSKDTLETMELICPLSCNRFQVAKSYWLCQHSWKPLLAWSLVKVHSMNMLAPFWDYNLVGVDVTQREELGP